MPITTCLSLGMAKAYIGVAGDGAPLIPPGGLNDVADLTSVIVYRPTLVSVKV